MSTVKMRVAAEELRVGDLVELPNGDAGQVSALAYWPTIVVVTTGALRSIVGRRAEVVVTLEDDGGAADPLRAAKAGMLP